MNPLDVLRLQYLQDLEKDEDYDYKIASISNDSINNTVDITLDKSDQVSIGKKQINRSLTKLLLPFPVSYPKKMPRKLVDSREISESTLLESSQIVNMVSIETGKIQVGSENQKEIKVKDDSRNYESPEIMQEFLIQQSEDDVQRGNNLGQLETMQEFLAKSEVNVIEPLADKQKLSVKSVKKDQGRSRSKSRQQEQKEDQDLITPADTEPNESLETMKEFLEISQAKEQIKDINDKRQQKYKSRQKLVMKNNLKDQNQNDPLENNFNTNNKSKTIQKNDKGKSVSIQQQRDLINDISAELLQPTEIRSAYSRLKGDSKMEEAVGRNINQNKSQQEPIKKEKIHSRSQSDHCEKLMAEDGDTDDSKKTTTRAQRHSRSYSLQPKEEEHNISFHGSITLDNATAIEIIHENLDSQKDNMLGGETTLKSVKNAVKNEQNLSVSHILQDNLLTGSSDMLHDDAIHLNNSEHSYLEPSERTKTTNKHNSKIKTAQKIRKNHSASKEQHFNLMDSEEQLKLKPTQTLEHNDSDNSYEAFNDMTSKKNAISLSHMLDSFDNQDQLGISNKSNIPEKEHNHIKSEIQFDNKLLTLQRTLPIDHNSNQPKTIQAQKNNITKIKKLKFINSIDTDPDIGVTYASALKRMIPDLSKEPIDLHKKERNPSNTKPKSILKKPQSREIIISMTNTIVPKTNGLEENQLDLLEEFDLKPNGTTKIITKTLTSSLSKSVDTFTNHESVSTFANIDQDVKLIDKPAFQDISSSSNVVPHIRRAQTAPTAVRKHDGAVQTFDQDCKLSDQKPSSKTVGDIAKASKYRDDYSASESRPASPSGYMIAYKMSSQKLHFDPGVYSDFKGIESAKVWLHKKNVVQRKPKYNTVKLQKNLSSIDEDMGSSKADSPKAGFTGISPSDNSESDDESLRRVAVRQASFTALEAQDLESTKINLLVFDASTQTKNDYLNVKKVRMKVENPTDGGSTLKRNSQIQVKDTKPSKYMDKYLSTEKKKPKKLPPLKSPLFSPIKSRPISRSSSSRSSRSASPVLSDKHKKRSKSTVKYSKIPAKILNAGSSKHNQNHLNEYQLDPYMPASWYLPYDYISSSIPQQPMSHYNTFNLPSNAHFGSPTNQFMIDLNAPQIPSSPFYSTNHLISQSENQNQYLESLYSNPSLYSSLPLLNSQTSIYSQPNTTYSQPKVPKVSKEATNFNCLTNNPMMKNIQSIDLNQQFPSGMYENPQSKKTKSFKNTTDLSQTRPWH